MRKILILLFISFFTFKNANALCLFKCEVKEKCRNYAESSGGDESQVSDAYDYCMKREQNKKDFGKPLDKFIKQN